ncbi:hypothetical protein VY88_01400 [Azospirillum thiophilum]|uniref:Uncharacterized protein n=1 Tax=Azospirillum thiophilum TaxID=528244 RepID=A0AAC8VXP8_9PROT|nr:hypothetical protein [Azospirillum thiophilum]ALG71400.1 hypothetical protein AL072_11310 [Azospirillum thiophilum]KJR66993.1 hypothetical protein VY88_01400 [Azospirillum thiophilum]
MRSSFKTGLIGAALTLAAFAAGAAHADTVSITTHANVSAPAQMLSSAMSWAQNPTTPNLTVSVAGKTCTLVSSLQAIGPVGCNYALTVGPDATITGALTAGNQGCTPTPQVASSCK